MDNQNAAETGKTKICSRCKQELPVSEFSKCRTKRDGLQIYCKPCHRQTVLNWQKKYPERAGIRNAKWKRGNEDQVRAANREYRRKNIERLRAANIEYWRNMPPERKREIRRRDDLWKHYRLRPEEYEQMFSEQSGACAICGIKDFGVRKPAVDHCHKTGKVRGLLCGHCNPLLHKLEADSNWMQKAIDYLTRFKT